MSFTFELSFADIPFVMDEARIVRMSFARPEQEPESGTNPTKQQPLANLIDEVNRLIDMRLLQDFGLLNDWDRTSNSLARNWPASNWPNATLQIGEWYYPAGASRWSVFRGLATSRMAKAMLEATSGRIAKPFVMQCVPISPGAVRDAYRITSNLYMLPPRPLAEHGTAFAGLSLITLVDERYYWQFNSATLDFQPGDSWASLINTLASELGVSITFSAIDSAYGMPEKDSQLWAQQGNAPELLDAIAGNLGRTLVREFDGTYTLLTPQESYSRTRTNRSNGLGTVRIAGGEIFNSGSPATMLGRNAVVPAAVNVVFPQYVVGNDPVPHFINKRYQGSRPTSWFEDGFGGAYVNAIGIASGTCYSGSTISGLVGTSEHTVWTTAKALYSGEADIGGNPLNGSGLTALAVRIAQDVYDNQCLAAIDEVYPGTLAWRPDGLHDLLWTWSERKRQASCRVMRTEWNQAVVSMQHAVTPPSGIGTTPGGLGGTSVAQSWRDSISTSGLALAALRIPLASGDYKISTTSIHYFPTQNRWKLLVGGQEKILAEGTSGKTYFDLVQRGIDGTVQQEWPAGAQVQWINPNTTFGVNLVTFEKNQFVFPQEVTSGGVQGVHVVPQTQTVMTVEASGRIINGVLHYSGRVQTIRTMTDGLSVQSQYLNDEPVWIRDRNGAIVPYNQRLGGMFIGFSQNFTVSGKADPVYVVDAPPQLGFWARLTEVATGGCLSAYSFKEVLFDGCGVVIKTNGIQGEWDTNPAYEAGQNSTLPVGEDCGFVAWMRYDSLTGSYRFYENEELVPVKLTSAIAGGYSWVEVMAVAGGTYAIRPGGRSGVAYELNLNKNVPVGSIVWIRRRVLPDNNCTEWGFQYESGGDTIITNIYNYGDVTIITIINGVPNTIYFICDNVYACDGIVPSCKLYVWVCQQDICGWYDVCDCQWQPQCYWCTADGCVLSFEAPDENASGPYLTEELCEEDCGSLPWWCVETEEPCVECPDEVCVGEGDTRAWNRWIITAPPPIDPMLAELGGSFILNKIGDCLWASGNSSELPRWVLGPLNDPNNFGLLTMTLQWFSSDGRTGTATPQIPSAFICCGGVNAMVPTDFGQTWIGGQTISLAGTEDATCDCEGTEVVLSCIPSEVAPPDAISGPHDTQQDCQTTCATGDLYWCVVTTTPPTSDCGWCCSPNYHEGEPPGYPDTWEITVPAPTPNPPTTMYDGFVGTFTLTHFDGCIWKTPTGQWPQWTISINLAGFYLIGVLEDGTTVEGLVVLYDWNCCGTNFFVGVVDSNSQASGTLWGLANPIEATPGGECACDADQEGDETYECVQAANAPPGTVGEGHATEAECLEECGSDVVYFWCCGGECIESATDPSGSCGTAVRYDTQEECENNCSADGYWWCCNGECIPGGATAPACDLEVGAPPPERYDTQGDCIIGCEGAVELSCCDRLLPNVLLVTVTDKTGDLTALPDSFTVEWDEASQYWIRSALIECNLTPIGFTIECDPNNPSPEGFLATALGPSTLVDTGAVCSPALLLVWTARTCGDPNCIGTATFTVTEVP